jgi:hypothetical protein
VKMHSVVMTPAAMEGRGERMVQRVREEGLKPHRRLPNAVDVAGKA